MQEPRSKLRIEDLTTSNQAMARCLQLAALAAKSDVAVVLLGETGTGKTLLAHAIHNSSARAGRPFVAFDASAISDTLLESQLFGHERGAFTGAQQSVKGKFELADGGTLFLDEISEMSPLAQVKSCACSNAANLSGSAPNACSHPTRESSAHQTVRCGNESGRENSGKTFTSASMVSLCSFLRFANGLKN